MRPAPPPAWRRPGGRRGPADPLRVGAATFDAETGRLTALGGLTVDGPVIDVWRAPTDNDRGRTAPAASWYRHGLHRMRHRTDTIDLDGDALVVRGRLAPSAEAFGLRVGYRWTAVADDAVRLELSVDPDGPWPDLPLPRLGVRLAVPAHLDQVSWYGPGPHEAYPDIRRAARVGAYEMTVDRMQTPYTHPQENGHRIDVRTATLTDPRTGTGLAFDGIPVFGLTARRWTSEDLDAAAHPVDLVPHDRLFVNLDLAHHGIGTGSCGPGTLERYRLDPAPASFAVVLRTTRRQP